MSDSIVETEEIYDDYVKYYNDAGNTISDHISILAELSIIEQTVKDHGVELEEMLKGAYEYLKLGLESIPEELELIPEGIIHEKYAKFNNELLEIKLATEIKDFKSSNHGAIGTTFTSDDLTSLKAKIDELFEGYEIEKAEIIGAIRTVEGLLVKYRQALNHKMALWPLNMKIIYDYYPPELSFYKELTEDEKSKIRSNGKKLGAPLSKEVPQDEVEEIVINLLEKYERGERVETNRDGRKMMYQVIHDGKREGKANVNQILKYFEVEHPNLLNITNRQFRERIKKAIPKDMK